MNISICRKKILKIGIFLLAVITCMVCLLFYMKQNDFCPESISLLAITERNGMDNFEVLQKKMLSCITNKEKMQADDLINWSDSVYFNENTIIEIDVSAVDTDNSIIGYYIVNCATKEKNKIPLTVKKYGITESGNYIVYALTNAGKTINLNQSLEIEEQTERNESVGGFQTL